MICTACGREKSPSEFCTGFERRHCKSCVADARTVRKHGLTSAQKQDIAAAQGGCAICGHAEPNSRGWVVDHDHECCLGEKSCPKCRRGVICSWCNAVLGNAFDRPEILAAAIAYLERHASGTCDWHMPLACAPGICGDAIRASSTDVTDGRTNAESFESESESHVSERARAGQEIDVASVVNHG